MGRRNIKAGLKSKGSRKGQVSTEYLMVISFSLLILLPVIVMAVSYSEGYQSRAKADQIKSAADQITAAADAVYFEGSPAKRTLKIYIPDIFESASTYKNTLIMTARGQNGLFTVTSKSQYSNLTWNASIGGAGFYYITVEATGNNVTIGESSK